MVVCAALVRDLKQAEANMPSLATLSTPLHLRGGIGGWSMSLPLTLGKKISTNKW